MNVFRKAHHILVDNADPVLYSQVLETMESQEDKGVLVTLIEQHHTNDGGRTAMKSYSSCPVAASSSLAHQIERNTGGTNRRMICEIQQLNVSVSVTFAPGGRIYDYSYETNLIVTNKRRSGFSWIRTFPNFIITNTTSQRIRVNRLLQGVNLSNNFPLQPVNYIGIASGGVLNNPFLGIADLVHPLDEDMGTIDFSFSSRFSPCPDCVLNTTYYAITDGRANVTWTNHDLGMSVELGCP